MGKKSIERVKKTGEIFTPLSLVDEMLDHLSPIAWTDKSKTFCDPACGNGNFLVRVIAYKIFHGSTPRQAISTVYGVDLMEDNVSECRGRLLTHLWCAYRNPDVLLGHLTPEQERQFGQAKGRDTFCRKYDQYVIHNIVCADSLNGWDFENWQPKNIINPALVF